VLEASTATNKKLLQTLDWARPIDENSRVLDLGAGTGGAARSHSAGRSFECCVAGLSHEIMQKYGCHVTSFNISPEQNKENAAEAARLGVAQWHEVVLGNLNDGLPAGWAGTFTHAISCEVHCCARPQNSFSTCIHALRCGAMANVLAGVLPRCVAAAGPRGYLQRTGTR
jgi:cyclopropane fatty-acyl-phospholipid synthase-like methyltransferase